MRFEDVKPRFWDLSVSHEVLAPLTDADVRRAEDALGYRLPAAYVELLRVQSGGYVSREFDAFPSPEPTSWADDHVWLRTMMGIGAPDEFGSILQSPALNTEWDMPPQLVLLSGDGHFWIALDYRSTLWAAEPSVVWIDNEVDEDLQLARDFAAFVEGLVPMDSFAD